MDPGSVVTEEFRHHARSGDDSRGYEMAPPVGFEPTLPAPEGTDQDGADQHRSPQRPSPGRVVGATSPARGSRVTSTGRAFFEGHRTPSSRPAAPPTAHHPR